MYERWPLMNADENRSEPEFLHEELTGQVIGVFYDVYNELGHGFLESVYEKALAVALRQRGFVADTQRSIQVLFRGHVVGDFVADIVVNDTLILELKAAKVLDAAHEAQTLNYLRATDLEVGLLLNFGPKPQIRRFAFSNSRKQTRGEA
jgi:GxxExxY protein